LRPDRTATPLAKLASSVGWKYEKVVQTLEAKRKAKGKVYIQRKKSLDKLRQKAFQNKKEQISSIQTSMHKLGQE